MALSVIECLRSRTFEVLAEAGMQAANATAERINNLRKFIIVNLECYGPGEACCRAFP